MGFHLKISLEYPKFVKDIEEYEDFINKFYTLLEYESNIPTDVIKYEIMNKLHLFNCEYKCKLIFKFNTFKY